MRRRTLGQLGEGLHGEREVLLASVFDLIVTDAVERLDEQHDGGDAGAGDFGGVVQGAGGQAMQRSGEGDEVGVEGQGLDTPDARPLDGAALFGGHRVTESCLGHRVMPGTTEEKTAPRP